MRPIEKRNMVVWNETRGNCRYTRNSQEEEEEEEEEQERCHGASVKPLSLRNATKICNCAKAET